MDYIFNRGTKQTRRASAPITIKEIRQKLTQKNARELLLPDVIDQDMVVICAIGIIIGIKYAI